MFEEGVIAIRRMLLLALTILIGLSGCGTNGGSYGHVEDGLVVDSISYRLGGDEDLTGTVVSYTFNLWNRTDRSVRVRSIEPVLSEQLRNRLTNGATLELDTPVGGNSSKAFAGSFSLDTQGLSKEDISNLPIQLDEFRVVTEQVVGRSKAEH